MCGINGVLLNRAGDEGEVSNLLSKMNQKIIHRGPDDNGSCVFSDENFRVGMAMRRLSIIDLSTGKQPIFSDDGLVAIVFNGEIYNYKILKSGLQKEGVEFRTHSDTEVILRLYEAYGTDSFAMLDGMFAFSIYDNKKKKIFIARDFFGEKPLYYTQNSSGISWASELKSIITITDTRPEISQEGMSLFFQLTYIPAPFTIYKGIKKLEPNHFLEIDCLKSEYGIFEIEQSFENDEYATLDLDSARKKTKELVAESVISRSVSDVPIGTFLSGGVDSSIVSLALAKSNATPINTFSIGFEKKSFDESDKSRTVANLIKSHHHEFVLSVDDLRKSISEIILNFDEPFADSSSLPTYFVAHKTRQEVKVALTGDGGDEVFGGYNKYYMGKLNQRYTSLVPRSLHNSVDKVLSPLLFTKDDKRGKRFKARKLLNAINYDDQFYFNIISLGFQERELDRICKETRITPHVLDYYKTKLGNKINDLNGFRNADRFISLEGDMLVKVDRTSMLTSLESRAPFLNKKLWNFTRQLPEEYLLNGWNKKFLLKEAFKEEFPEGFLDKSKKGFGVPVGDWLRGDLSKELKSYIDKDFLKVQGLFEPEEVSNIVNRHLEGKEDNTFKVWTFFCFQKWYKNIYQQI